MAARPVGQQFVSVDEYDVMVYPGFLRRTVRSARLSRVARALVGWLALAACGGARPRLRALRSTRRQQTCLGVSGAVLTRRLRNARP
jgi:hypothetical protein